MEFPDVKEMTPEQRVLAMEKLWAAMSQDEKEIESPSWHNEILEQRHQRIVSGEAKFISLKELKAQLQQ